jgi:hypothetical protein
MQLLQRLFPEQTRHPGRVQVTQLPLTRVYPVEQFTHEPELEQLTQPALLQLIQDPLVSVYPDRQVLQT